jgi:hypothetical protein
MAVGWSCCAPRLRIVLLTLSAATSTRQQRVVILLWWARPHRLRGGGVMARLRAQAAAALLWVSLVATGPARLLQVLQFFADSASRLRAVRLDSVGRAWQIALPIGISFYTFTSELRDRRLPRRDPAERNWWDFAFFIAFFRSWWRVDPARRQFCAGPPRPCWMPSS